MDTMYVNFKNKLTKGYSKNQVTLDLGISRPTLDKLIAENRIQTTKKGKSRLILEPDYIRLKEIITTGYDEQALTMVEDIDSNITSSVNLEENTSVTSVKNDVKPDKIIEIELLRKENEKLELEIDYFKRELESARADYNNVRADYREELNTKNILLKEREETFKQTIANFEKIIAIKEKMMLNLNNKLLYLEQNFTGRNEELEKLKTEKDNKIKTLMEQIAIKDAELCDAKLTRGQIVEIESSREILQGRVNSLEKEKETLENNLELGMLEKDNKITTLTKNVANLERVKLEKERLEKELEELRNKGFLNKLKKIFGLK